MFSNPVGLALASDPRLTARMFRIVLLVFANLDGAGEAALSNEQIATATGLDARDVRRALAEMQGLGLLSARMEGRRRHLRPLISIAGQGGAVRPGATRPPSAIEGGHPAPGGIRPPSAAPPHHEIGEIDLANEGSSAPPSPSQGGAARPGVAPPPRVPPPGPPSPRPPAWAQGETRAPAGEGPAPAEPEPEPEPETWPGAAGAPEEEADRRAAQEYADRFVPQLAYRVRELLSLYPGSLVLYALQEALHKGKTRTSSYVLGICREQSRAGWAPPPRASPAPAPPSPARRPLASAPARASSPSIAELVASWSRTQIGGGEHHVGG